MQRRNFIESFAAVGAATGSSLFAVPSLATGTNTIILQKRAPKQLPNGYVTKKQEISISIQTIVSVTPSVCSVTANAVFVPKSKERRENLCDLLVTHGTRTQKLTTSICKRLSAKLPLIQEHSALVVSQVCRFFMIRTVFAYR